MIVAWTTTASSESVVCLRDSPTTLSSARPVRPARATWCASPGSRPARATATRQGRARVRPRPPATRRTTSTPRHYPARARRSRCGFLGDSGTAPQRRRRCATRCSPTPGRRDRSCSFMSATWPTTPARRRSSRRASSRPTLRSCGTRRPGRPSATTRACRRTRRRRPARTTTPTCCRPRPRRGARVGHGGLLRVRLRQRALRRARLLRDVAQPDRRDGDVAHDGPRGDDAGVGRRVLPSRPVHEGAPPPPTQTPTPRSSTSRCARTSCDPGGRGRRRSARGHSHIYERTHLVHGAYDTPTTAAGHIVDRGDGPDRW